MTSAKPPTLALEHIRRPVSFLSHVKRCLRLHGASNASNIGYLYDVTHHVAVIHMANDKCQASNIGTGTHSAACWFFCPMSKDVSNVGTQTVATTECSLPMLGYSTHHAAGSLHHQHWLEHLLHISPNVCFQHSTHRAASP